MTSASGRIRSGPVPSAGSRRIRCDVRARQLTLQRPDVHRLSVEGTGRRAYFNNDREGFAPRNAAQLKPLLE